MKILNSILDLLFPPKCAFCSKIIKSNYSGMCEHCGFFLPYTRGNNSSSADFITSCTAPLYYEKYVRKSLHRFKFSSRKNYAEIYAPMLAESIRKEFEDGFTVLTWIPVSKKRLRQRGYDQAELLAIEVGKLLDMKPVKLLEKNTDTKAQSAIGNEAEKRKINILGAYSVCNNELVENAKILLIDDIFTTGSTMSESAKTLLRGGADCVMGACVAKRRD